MNWLLPALLLTLSTASGAAAGLPTGVSPGAADRVMRISTPCPTFSWESQPGAPFYELAVYALADDAMQRLAESDGIPLGTEALYVRVQGGASSWTPDLDRCLEPAKSYAWFVRVGAEEGGVREGAWSGGLLFSVVTASGAGFLEREGALPPSPPTRRSPGSHPAASPPASEPQASRSVSTAPAAIRGTQNDSTGEVYGVVGTTDSPGGAGVAAANSASGPDLVLDGSLDGEVDARWSQAGLDRPSTDPQSFSFENSSGGGMSLEIDGEAVVTTATDQDTQYSAGTGLDLNGTELSVDTGTIQARVDGTCPAGSSIRVISSAGAVTCEVDSIGGDVSAVHAGDGLAGGGTSGDLTLGIADKGVTSVMLKEGVVNTAAVGTRPSARAHRLGQPIHDGYNQAHFDVEVWDTSTIFTTGTLGNHLTPREPGLYLITSTMAFDPSRDLRREVRMVYRDAAQTTSTFIASEFTSAIGGSRTVSLSTVYPFQGDGDHVLIELLVDADETMNSTIPSSMTIIWLGPLP